MFSFQVKKKHVLLLKTENLNLKTFSLHPHVLADRLHHLDVPDVVHGTGLVVLIDEPRGVQSRRRLGAGNASDQREHSQKSDGGSGHGLDETHRPRLGYQNFRTKHL